MDWYLVLKFCHVASVVIWIGGAFIMVTLASRADRQGDEVALVGCVRQVAWAAERIYVPASISTLLFGLVLAWLTALWGSLWIILGLCGIAATLLLGIFVLSPLAKKAEAGFSANGITPDVVATCQKILTIAKFDTVLLFTVIADMVLKPQSSSDWPVLLLMALAIAAAAALWMIPVRRKLIGVE
jgi:uncharacterized membrane protein